MRWALQKYLIFHANQVERSMRNPREAQVSAFARIQRELGSAPALAHCQVLEDCRHLPRSDSETLRPLLDEAMRTGSARAFGSSSLMGFARTSGTSGRHKDIPLTR